MIGDRSELVPGNDYEVRHPVGIATELGPAIPVCLLQSSRSGLGFGDLDLRLLLDRSATRRRALTLLTGGVLLTGMFARFGDQIETATPGTIAIGSQATDILGSPDDVATGPAIAPSGHFMKVQVFGDGTKHLVPIEDVFSGGPDKDDIPAITQPKFVGPDLWKSVDYRDDGLVIGVEVNGQRRAYPFQVLVWHEIVNDIFDGVPVLITYCPLCGSGVVFRREIDGGDVVDFGVTGRLYNSNLLMYDRKSNSVWSQLTGTAVIGELTGQRLEMIPSELLTWSDWKLAYPDSRVLSRDTGYERNYDGRPYGSYDQTISIGFPVAVRDNRLHPKTRITGIELNPTTYGAFPDDLVREYGPVNHHLGGEPILVVADLSSGANVVAFKRVIGDRTLSFSLDDSGLVDHETGTNWTLDGVAHSGDLTGARLEAIPTVKAFWFAWIAFHSDSALWLPGS